jgi:hypothetical protein
MRQFLLADFTIDAMGAAPGSECRSPPMPEAEGVAEVASVGGFVKQYNIVVDPPRLRAQGISLAAVRDAVRNSNQDIGGRTVELSEFEYVVRGRGYIKSPADIENIVLKTAQGVPLRVKDVARVEIGPDERRGVTELNGEGEVASGIVLQRFGANALTVIDNVKQRLADIAGSLPKGAHGAFHPSRANSGPDMIESWSTRRPIQAARPPRRLGARTRRGRIQRPSRETRLAVTCRIMRQAAARATCQPRNCAPSSSA